jgi:hypothetical protein
VIDEPELAEVRKGSFRRALATTSSMLPTNVKVNWRASCRGISSRSFRFCSGTMISVIPARRAPSAFSFNPPIGSTRPLRVISPVIATSRLTGIPVREEMSAVAIVMPAEGPSFGIAPAGTWMWMSELEWKSLFSPSREARDRV